HPHHGALTELPFDLSQSALQSSLTLGIGLGVSDRAGLRASDRSGLRVGFLVLAHLSSAPCLMRFEPPTVGPVADGTGKLEPSPVTEQDAFATEGAQISANSERRAGRYARE